MYFPYVYQVLVYFSIGHNNDYIVPLILFVFNKNGVWLLLIIRGPTDDERPTPHLCLLGWITTTFTLSGLTTPRHKGFVGWKSWHEMYSFVWYRLVRYNVVLFFFLIKFTGGYRPLDTVDSLWPRYINFLQGFSYSTSVLLTRSPSGTILWFKFFGSTSVTFIALL